jgi:hypothetical protein
VLLTGEPTQPPIQWVPEALSLGVKRPGREADHSPPSSAEVKKSGAIPPLRNTSSWRDAWLSKGTLPYHAMKVYWGSGSIAPFVL